MNTDRHFLGRPVFVWDLQLCNCCSHRELEVLTSLSMNLYTYSDWQDTATMQRFHLYERIDVIDRWVCSWSCMKVIPLFHIKIDHDLFKLMVNVEQPLYVGGRTLLQWLKKRSWWWSVGVFVHQRKFRYNWWLYIMKNPLGKQIKE